MRSCSRTTTILGVAVALGLASASALAADHPVSVGGGGLTFSPAVLNISAGDTVTFTNAGGFHNAVSNPGAVTSFRCANGCDGDGGNGDPSSTAWSATVAFPTPGTIGYFCEIHGAPGQGMSGTINVTIPVELQTFEVD
jgi:plastocyanin